MSKITLEPNDSGAGTFSIVSPDSNINRTLNLPDEAGKLLSTGNNDPAEVFKQSNILGTVSESGGVPTGAIIQQGSNANGYFVKYADGTIIVGRRTTLGDISQYGDLNFIGSLPFPAEMTFAFGGAVSVGVGTTSSSRAGLFSISGRVEGNSWRRIALTRLLSFTPSGTQNVQFNGMAIGRWY